MWKVLFLSLVSLGTAIPCTYGAGDDSVFASDFGPTTGCEYSNNANPILGLFLNPGSYFIQLPPNETLQWEITQFAALGKVGVLAWADFGFPVSVYRGGFCEVEIVDVETGITTLLFSNAVLTGAFFWGPERYRFNRTQILRLRSTDNTFEGCNYGLFAFEESEVFDTPPLQADDFFLDCDLVADLFIAENAYDGEVPCIPGVQSLRPLRCDPLCDGWCTICPDCGQCPTELSICQNNDTEFATYLEGCLNATVGEETRISTSEDTQQGLEAYGIDLRNRLLLLEATNTFVAATHDRYVDAFPYLYQSNTEPYRQRLRGAISCMYDLYFTSTFLNDDDVDLLYACLADTFRESNGDLLRVSKRVDAIATATDPANFGPLVASCGGNPSPGCTSAYSTLESAFFGTIAVP